MTVNGGASKDMKERGRVWRWVRRGLLAGGAIISVLVLTLLGMFGFLQLQSRQPVKLPAPSGQYNVGRAIYDWTDSSRADRFSPGGRGRRELSVWVWYPARVPGGSKRAAYLPPQWQHAVQGTDFVHTRADAITTNSWENAPVAGATQPFPVVVFMPGFGRVAADYTTLAEDLASHGYAVFGVNPTYISDDVVLGQGRVVAANRQVAQEVDNADSRKSTGPIVVEVEAADMRFVLGQAEALDHMAGQRFAGRLDTSRAGMLGHSIGGAAATRGCEVEARCAGAVNIDGAVFGPVVGDGVGKPYLFLGEDRSLSAVPASELRGVLRNVPDRDGRVLTVTGAGHMNFSDMSVLYKFPPNQLGLIGPIEGGRAIKISRAYVNAFFAATLRNQPGADLPGPAREYPEVHVVRGFS